MKKKKILVVFGTRPEAIKMAPLVPAINATKDLTACVCVTAQHRQMLDDVLSIFKVKTNHDLNIMEQGQTLFHITSAVLLRMEAVLKKEKPAMVLVHGDTTTAFAAALAAFYMQIPVGHVEAGLRSYDLTQPFPEEANRVLVDRIAALYFAPTDTSKKALVNERVAREKICITGNTVIDALHWVLAKNKPFTEPHLKKMFARGSVTPRTILVTCHRRENFGQPMEDIFNALRDTAQKHPAVRIIYPVHLNPRVQEPAKRILGNLPNVHLLPPVNYIDLAKLMQLSYLVATDSGGIQEEAPALGKPVLVMRNVTERPEAVAAGTVRLVGSNRKKIVSEIDRLLADNKYYTAMSQAQNPYGDGAAAARTVHAIRHHLGLTTTRTSEFVYGKKSLRHR